MPKTLQKSWYSGVLWPITHFAATFTIASSPTPVEPSQRIARPTASITEHLIGTLGGVRSFVIAWICIYGFTLSEENSTYPAFSGAAKEGYNWSWMAPILIRNVAFAWVVCGFWDWILYFSPLKDKLHPFKHNPVYPSFPQFAHDATFTTISVVLASFLEIAMCRGWANGSIPYQPGLHAHLLTNFLWAMLINYWRIPHFFFTHRLMHPWAGPKEDSVKIALTRDVVIRVPDLGKFLYKHVHALHHKSYNPTAFSGTSMHPVESAIYYTAALIPVFFAIHPIVFVTCIIDLGIGAWLAHDGFQWPGNGEFFHQLHHAHFVGNYGNEYVPFDYWFGTFMATKADIDKLNRKK
jgi:hypothetical protein